MKIVVNPNSSVHTEFIRGIVHSEFECDIVLRDHRNRIDKVTAYGGMQLVIKKYQIPNLFRRLIYTVSPSKARLSYECALKLQNMGIGTAEPVAYIETASGGLFHTCYFISSYITCALMDKLDFFPQPEQRHIIHDFAAFTADMHKKGVRHCDYNPKNIFLHKEENGHYSFYLIDINRMHFGKMSRQKCIKEFSRLGFSLPVLVEIAEQYAIQRGWKPDRYCTEVLAYRTFNPYWYIKRAVRPLRRFWIKST